MTPWYVARIVTDVCDGTAEVTIGKPAENWPGGTVMLAGIAARRDGFPAVSRAAKVMTWPPGKADAGVAPSDPTKVTVPVVGIPPDKLGGSRLIDPSVGSAQATVMLTGFDVAV